MFECLLVNNINEFDDVFFQTENHFYSKSMTHFTTSVRQKRRFPDVSGAPVPDAIEARAAGQGLIFDVCNSMLQLN